MTTLSDIMLDVVASLGQVAIYTASGGSATTAVCATTNIEDPGLSGWILITETTDGLAPQGEFADISSFAPATGTFTFGTLTAAVESGDKFAYITPSYPLNNVINEINRGLRRLGYLQGVDTTLTTGSNQTEYTASADWVYKIEGVEVEKNPNDSDDNRWSWVNGWKHVRGTAGNTGLIETKQQLPPDRTMRIWYLYQHARLTDYNDVVDGRIAPELAVAAATERILAWLNSRTQGENSFLLQRWNEAKDELNETRRRFPVQRQRVSAGRLFTIG